MGRNKTLFIALFSAALNTLSANIPNWHYSLDSITPWVTSTDLASLPESKIRGTIDSLARIIPRDERVSLSTYLLTHHPIYKTNWGPEGNLFPEVCEFTSTDTFQFTLLEGSESFYFNYFGSFNWGYGPRWGRMHRGWDLGLNVGDTLKSSFNGVVRYAEYNEGGYGNCVVVRHLNGLETLYAHMSELNCKRGDFVLAGESLGLGGSTGRSTGPHLHWEWRFHCQSFDAMLAIDTSSFALRSDVLTLTKKDLTDPPEYQIKKTAKSKSVYHTVKSGETLSSIARKYKTSVSKLTKLNRLRDANKLKIGQRIRVK